MRITILGRSEYLYDSVELLAKHHHICGIFTAKAAPEYSRNEDDFRKLAEKLKCPYYLIKTINESVIENIHALKSDICISVNWVTTLMNDFIELFPNGVLNCHFGDLPSYRGNAVINWAILNNEKQIALTIHQMESGEIDSGNIWAKLNMKLDKNTPIKDVVDFSRKNTPLLFLEAVNSIEKKDKAPIPQSSLKQKVFRCYPRLPEYSKIDWSKSAAEIHALINASSEPYSGAYSYLKTNNAIKKIFIWESSIESESTDDKGVPGHIIHNDKKNGYSKVMTGKGILILKKVQYENEDPFLPGMVWKSIRMHFGIDIEEEIINLYKLLK
jgi:methionyl-tRNA formyltransferase